jgi:lipoyl(octanoyl) transferase
LRYFELIVPCGIADRKATSLEKLLGRNVSLGEIKPMIAKHLGEVFGLTIQTAPREELFEKLREFEQALPVPA